MSDSNDVVLCENIFAPVATDFIDHLVGQYRHELTTVERVASAMGDAAATNSIGYFMKGNKQNQHSVWYGIESLFNLSGAVKALNASYWQRALSMTDVYDYMPQARRDEWYKQIEAMNTPDFTDAVVRDTLGSLLAMRSQFLAERVDGIFRNLSGDHVTNQPQGFGKRMIINGVTDNFSFSNGSRCGYIDDLRSVIAKFMGRDTPRHGASSKVVAIARTQHGEWISIDGGALRIRVYMKGTAHLEVHPEMAWRLNMILASIYPSAIPASFRSKPLAKNKEFVMHGRPLPFAVIDALSSMEGANKHISGSRYEKIPNAVQPKYWGVKDGNVLAEVDAVLMSIGGIKVNNYFQFDYDVRAVLNEIICSGCIPDQKAHQFYPTPARLARIAVDLAEIGDDICLEPSAGIGCLADLMPKAQTVCVEISSLHCSVLTAKGYAPVYNMDFLAFDTARYDRIVMNPPFSEGRWMTHLAHASSLLANNGRLVAILPASAKNKNLLPAGFDCEWHGPYNNEFAGTSVSVVILVAVRGV